MTAGTERSDAAFARSYDDLTADYQYESWVAALLAKAEQCGLHGTRLLDMGCGTGKSFLPMLDRGWQVTACDISPAMIDVALQKVGDVVALRVADLRALPDLGEFDLIWAVNDTINNLLSPDDLDAALTGMRRNLAAGGRIVFDLNTFCIYRDYFTAGAVVERGGARQPVWRGMTPSEAVTPGAICNATMETQGPTESHPHRQRHFTAAEVIAALGRADLECVDVSGEQDGVLGSPLDESVHTKAVYVACKTRSS